MKTLAPTNTDAAAAVRGIYRELESRPVDRACMRRTECCQFKLTGKTPYLTAGEALLAARSLRATGRTRLDARPDGVCPLLVQPTGRCLIYEDRPFACRTHFCAAAGGPYARREVIDLIHRLEDLDRALGGEGPRPITTALQAALAKHRGD
jgi:Fe-S-cluster containining protein